MKLFVFFAIVGLSLSLHVRSRVMDPAADKAAAAAAQPPGGLPPGATDAAAPPADGQQPPADGQQPPQQPPTDGQQPPQQPATDGQQPPAATAPQPGATPPTFVKVQGDLLARARAMILEKPTAPITQEAFFKKIVEDNGSDANWKTYYTPKSATETGLVDTGSVMTFIDSRVPGSKRYMVAVISRGCGSGSESTSSSSETFSNDDDWEFSADVGNDSGETPVRGPLPGFDRPGEAPQQPAATPAAPAEERRGFSASISKDEEGWKVGANINFLATKSQTEAKAHAKAKAPGGAYRFLMLVDGFPALTKCTTADEAVKYIDGANIVKLATVYVDKNAARPRSSFSASVSYGDDDEEYIQ